MAKKQLVNIASQLSLMAKIKPYTLAVIYPEGTDGTGRTCYTHYTIKQLNEQSSIIAHGLESFGIVRGMRTVLMVKPCLDFFTLTFALFKVGAIPVMIDPGIGTKNLGICLEEAEPRAFIGIPKAQAARILFGWGKKTISISIAVGGGIFWGGPTLQDVIIAGSPLKEYKIANTTADDTAAILFTSGSTGISKGAVYTHGIFDAQVKSLRDNFGIAPGEMDIATFPLFALFGPALGMTSVIPDMDASRPGEADPRKIFQAIEDFGATNMFASPALIEKLGRYGSTQKIKLPSLKRVISAGAPASPRALKRFTRMLKSGVEIFTPYGATEALPVCKIGSDEILNETANLTNRGKGACVGYPVLGIKLKIIKITDEPIETLSDDLVLPDGEIGEIVVMGPVVTKEYYNRPESTKLAKIRVKKEGGFYHRMGDVGYIDHIGRVWYCGRKSHRVETPEGTLFTIPCEAVFNVHPEVFRTALVGVKRDGATQPVLCVELEKTANLCDVNLIIEELAIIGSSRPNTSRIRKFLFHPSFPVDARHNAKIFREKLAIWAKRNMP